jgi:hypothetical protein
MSLLTTLNNLVARLQVSSVGDVRSSFLTEAQFQSLNGTGWILADNRDVTGSAFHAITGLTTAPDCRGVGLRGKNNGRSDGNQDPAGERALGNFQNDAMQGHFHARGLSVNSNGTGGDGRAGAYGVATINNSFLPGVDHVQDPSTDGVHGNPRTGTETRAKNVAVNFFVRIN